jgi:hypothetical protein
MRDAHAQQYGSISLYKVRIRQRSPCVLSQILKALQRSAFHLEAIEDKEGPLLIYLQKTNRLVCSKNQDLKNE